ARRRSDGDRIRLRRPDLRRPAHRRRPGPRRSTRRRTPQPRSAGRRRRRTRHRAPGADRGGDPIGHGLAFSLRLIGRNRIAVISTRRRFLGAAGATVGLAGLARADEPGRFPFALGGPSAVPGPRPKLAAVTTVYHYLSHAYHIVGRFLDGFI